MKIIISFGEFLIFAGAFYFTVYLLQRMVPVKYFKSFLWAFKNKKIVLAMTSVFLIFVSSVLVLSSFKFIYLAARGEGEGVVVLGETMDTLIAINPEKPDQGIKEYELMPVSIAKPYLYPGQTFRSAINDRVMIKHPGHEHYTILFTHVAVYIFINC